MEKIQEILFENKESIPNGLYLELMDQLKKSYITKNENELIKITYTRVRPSFSKACSDCSSTFDIDLLMETDKYIIVKIIDFLQEHTYNPTREKIINQLEAIPFIPFWVDKKSCFNDSGWYWDSEYIFKKINANFPDDSGDDDDTEDIQNTRNIKFKLFLNYDIKYLITNVEKM